MNLTINAVNDVPHLVNATVTPTIDENGTATLSGSFTDPDIGDTHSVTVNWGEGSPVVVSLAAGVTTFTLTHQYLDDNPTVTTSDVYPVSVLLKDGQNASDTAPLSTTVTNVAPVVTAGSNATINEGALFSRTGSFSDTGTLDTWSATVNYGDGSGVQPLTLNPNHSFALSHTYGDNGVFTATVRVTDDDSGVGTAAITITVQNVAPTVSLSSNTASVQYSDPVTPVTISATDVPSDVLTATTSFNVNGGGFNSGLPGGLSMTPGTPGVWTLSGKVGVGPGTYVVRVNVADDDGASANADITLTVSQEDARITYSGPMLVATPSITTGVATVELRATIQDITKVLPNLDPNGGVITNATVTFVNRETGAVIAANLPVTLLQSNDSLTGTAVFNWVVDIGNADSDSFEIGIIVGGFYTRNHSDDDVLITVTRPLDYMVTGGGYLINHDSSGVYAGDEGRKTNFGFNVKFNQKLTNLQGHVNIIIRQNGIVYQIKTSAMQSLAVNPVAHTATFISKGNIEDITDPRHPISLGGNLTLIATITDPGEPGTSDTIGFTLWRGTQLLYSSHWTGTQTVEQLLDGGNLVIHTGGGNLEADVESANAPATVEALTPDTLATVVQNAIAVWKDSAITTAQAHDLSETQFVIADLAGTTLGISLGKTVWIDEDGAGLGWDVKTSAAQAKSFDLLSVVLHELGHTIGFEHADGGVMQEMLKPGLRVLPTTSLNSMQPASPLATLQWSEPERPAFDFLHQLSAASPSAAMPPTPSGNSTPQSKDSKKLWTARLLRRALHRPFSATSH